MAHTGAEMVVNVSANTDDLISVLEIVAKHAQACADELKARPKPEQLTYSTDGEALSG